MRLRIDSIEARNDGTGMVALDVWALDADGNVIPGKHATVLVSAVDVQAALAQPTAKLQVAALKAAVLAAVKEFSLANLTTVVTANAKSVSAVDKLIAAYGDKLPLSISL
jgi:hypothetical protein